MAVDTAERLPSVEKPWLNDRRNFSEKALKTDFAKDTIYNVVRNNNANNPDITAINFFGRKITYGKLLDTIDKAACAFEKAGVKKGDVVPVCCATIPEMVFCIYALNKLGATVHTIDPRRSKDFIKNAVDISSSTVFVFIDLVYPLIRSVIHEMDIKTFVSVSADDDLPFVLKKLKKLKDPAPKIDFGKNLVDWKTFLKTGAEKKSYTAKYGENDNVAITYTGGTTGDPKGVIIGVDGFNAIAESFNNCGVPYTRGIDRFLDIIPAFASYGIVASLHMPLALGLELIIIPKFDVNKVGYYFKKYKPHHTLMVPAHYEMLMNSKEMKNGFRLDFLKTAGTGGDTMNVGLEDKLNGFLKERGCPNPISQGYGMSEVSSAATCYCNGNFKSLSVGYPLLYTTVSVFKPGTTEECTYNEEGEVCMTGPAVMKGYYQNEEETRKVLITHPDGKVWVHSGDLGIIDEDGYIFIKGRIKRMITRWDGHKIFPSTIEDYLSKFDDIDNSGVIGVQDPGKEQGQIAFAVIQLKEGADADKVLANLKVSMEEDLEQRGRPSLIKFITERLPLTEMGKIDYQSLVKNYDPDDKDIITLDF